MSKITVDRALLEQALEALEGCVKALDALHAPGDSIYTRASDSADRAEIALRAALEQEEPAATRSPKENDRVICIEDESLGTVLWTDDAGGPYIKFDDGRYGQWMLHEFGKLFRYAALEQQAEVPLVVGCGGNNTTGSWSQEPVGWLESPHGAFRANLLYRMTAPQSIAWSIPVYITLPRREWQGLTEEQVKEVVHNTVEKVTVSESILFRAVARAIEAKLKERNHE